NLGQLPSRAALRKARLALPEPAHQQLLTAPCGMNWLSVRPQVTGASTLATAIPVACSLMRKPGRLMAVASTLLRPTKLRASSRLLWQRRFRQLRAGAHGQHVPLRWVCANT